MREGTISFSLRFRSVISPSFLYYCLLPSMGGSRNEHMGAFSHQHKTGSGTGVVLTTGTDVPGRGRAFLHEHEPLLSTSTNYIAGQCSPYKGTRPVMVKAHVLDLRFDSFPSSFLLPSRKCGRTSAHASRRPSCRYRWRNGSLQKMLDIGDLLMA